MREMLRNFIAGKFVVLGILLGSRTQAESSFLSILLQNLEGDKEV